MTGLWAAAPYVILVLALLSAGVVIGWIIGTATRGQKGALALSVTQTQLLGAATAMSGGCSALLLLLVSTQL